MTWELTEETYDSYENGCTTDIRDPSDGWRVATVYNTDTGTGLANLSLLLSAPDLLSACERVLSISKAWQAGEIPGDALMAERFIQAVYWATAKAKGEPEL